MKLVPCLILLLLLSGCAGFRGGIESVPYIGTSEPHADAADLPQPHEIVLPEFTIQLALNNTLQTYQFEVMLFAIPTYFNFWNEFRQQHAKTLELSLRIVARDSPVTIDPQKLVLVLDGQAIHPSGVWVNNRERERAVIEAYVKARAQASSDRPAAIPRSNQWRDAVSDAVLIRSGEQSPWLVITFPLPLLSPERDLALSLDRAVVAPSHSLLPRIRFKPMPWNEGYS